ncbi:MAG: hypothetical protein ACE5LU_22470 [Anaerolineae bacterium]
MSPAPESPTSDPRARQPLPAAVGIGGIWVNAGACSAEMFWSTAGGRVVHDFFPEDAPRHIHTLQAGHHLEHLERNVEGNLRPVGAPDGKSDLHVLSISGKRAILVQQGKAAERW